jgi:hypothetical protein
MTGVITRAAQKKARSGQQCQRVIAVDLVKAADDAAGAVHDVTAIHGFIRTGIAPDCVIPQAAICQED